jgi:hypothetical protein
MRSAKLGISDCIPPSEFGNPHCRKEVIWMSREQIRKLTSLSSCAG